MSKKVVLTQMEFIATSRWAP